MRCIEGRTSLRDESGIALVFAIQIMAVMTLMIATTLASAMSLGNTTERDVASKQALEGALGALDQARYRLSEVNPADNMCLTSAAVATGSGGAATGECPAYTGDLGNGTTYGYYVTPALTGGTCAGQTITASTTTDRCITGYGTSDGVTRRAQALVRREALATSVFPTSGILGLSKIEIKQTSSFDADIVGSVGSNGEFKLEGCPNSITGLTTWAPGPTASAEEKCTGNLTVQPPRSTPWAAPEAESMFTGTQSVNDNATVFGSASGFAYTASGRQLKDSSNATLIINGPNTRTGSGGVWVFNFCKLELTHVTTIKLLNGAVARFLVDAVDRAGSGCGNHAVMKVTNVSGMNYDTTTNTPGNPAAMQFFVYGPGDIDVSNQAGFSAALYAPGSKLAFTNKSTWVGSMVANEFKATNGLNFISGDVSSITEGGTSDGSWARATPGFVECRPAATSATDPESGC